MNTPLLGELFAAPSVPSSSQPVRIGSQDTPVAQPYWLGHVGNKDDGSHPEDNVSLPWCIDAKASFLDYRCTLDVLLDPGTVLHKPLPQTASPVDTLASVDVSNYALSASATTGVNLTANSRAVDLIQRMATSTYRFVLRGNGIRAGYQVPIPGLVLVGSLKFVPTWPQLASNEIGGSLFGGIPLWYASWELHYLVADCPRLGVTVLAAANPAARLRPDAELPKTVSVPRLPVDQNSVQGAGGRLGGIFR